MPTTEKESVRTPSVAYRRMNETWKLHHALHGGTPAMRNAGEEYLPREDKEEPLRYKARLARSVLYSALSDTVDKLTAKPFSRPIVVESELPDPLNSLLPDADGTGRSITNFAADVFWDALAYGKSHVLVDFPDASGVRTLAEERDLGLRPTFTHIRARDLIGWREENNSLTQIRYVRWVMRPRGEFGDQEVEQVVVWTPEWISEYEQNSEGKWVQVSQKANTLGKIPLATLYTNRVGFMESEPPLDDLAWLNLLHWQSSSDQRNILRFARMGILFAKGFTQEEIDDGITVSVNSLNFSTRADSDLKWVEHRGTAIEAGAKDLRELEERMEVLGLQPLIERSSHTTATGMAINENKAHTSIQAWITSAEALIRLAFEYAADWSAVQLPEDAKFDIFSDFGISVRAANNVAHLIAARKAREITRETFLQELKRYAVLDESLDVGLEAERLDEEGSDLSFAGVPVDDQGIDEE